jgi:GNAT superfamily N-acetyltransferase
LTTGPRIEARPVVSDELAEPLSLLEECLRDGVPLPLPFAERLKSAVERGDLEVLAARVEPGVGLVGVAVLAFRLNVSAGVPFASIEDFYVRPEARRKGAGRALLEVVQERCQARGVSYVEVQTDEAVPFYSAFGYKPEPGIQVLSRSYAL